MAVILGICSHRSVCPPLYSVYGSAIFNSMLRIDKSLLEAAYDTGASTGQMLTNVIIPLCRPGMIIGSIFVVTIVMGDFYNWRMGGQQIASLAIINVEMQYLQFPAAANAVILIFTTLMIIF